MSPYPPRILFMIAFILLAAGASAEVPLTQSRWSPAALYNLANAYARTGKPGMAVLNYERARLLAPSDPDIEANLLLVRRSAGLPPEPRSPLSHAVGDLNPTAASWIGLAGGLLVAAALLAGRLKVPNRWMRRSALIAGGALISLTVANGVALWPRIHAAVIIAAATPVRVSPAPMGDVLFSLKEAESVQITGEHEGFMLIRASGGRTGWAWHSDLAAVVP